MSRRTQENLLALALLCFFIGVLVLSLDYSPRARLVPIPISVLAMILLVAQIVWQNLRPADELHVDMLEFLTRRGIKPGKDDGGETDPAAQDDAPAAAEAGPSFGREAFAFAKVLLFVGLFLALGPFPAAFLFTFAYFSLSRHYHWARALVNTTIFTVVVYLLFVEVLEIQLYHGFLEPLVNDF